MKEKNRKKKNRLHFSPVFNMDPNMPDEKQEKKDNTTSSEHINLKVVGSVNMQIDLLRMENLTGI